MFLLDFVKLFAGNHEMLLSSVKHPGTLLNEWMAD